MNMTGPVKLVVGQISLFEMKGYAEEVLLFCAFGKGSQDYQEEVLDAGVGCSTRHHCEHSKAVHSALTKYIQGITY